MADKTELCPGCGQPPILRMCDTQAFCGNYDCRVFTWNPTKSAADNLASMNFIDLSFLEGGP